MQDEGVKILNAGGFRRLGFYNEGDIGTSGACEWQTIKTLPKAKTVV